MTGPSFDLIPGAGSPAQPCTEPCQRKACACHFWFRIYDTSCLLCGLPFGRAMWPVMKWGPFADGKIAHRGCYEERPEMESKWLRMPTVVEAVARKAGISLSAFAELPSYERERLVMPELDLVYPDWRERIKRDLAAARGLPDIAPSPIRITQLMLL